MVEATGTKLTSITGISFLGAARILGEVGNVRRFPSENHFASASGTAAALAVPNDPGSWGTLGGVLAIVLGLALDAMSAWIWWRQGSLGQVLPRRERETFAVEKRIGTP